MATRKSRVTIHIVASLVLETVKGHWRRWLAFALALAFVAAGLRAFWWVLQWFIERTADGSGTSVPMEKHL